MDELPNVCVSLPNRPENVLLVREILTGMCENIGLEDSGLNDLHTAVTEACNNVVLHAYEGDEGPLEVELYVLPAAIEVLVRDLGVGIAPRIRDVEENPLRIGLHVIHALAQRVEFNDVEDHGTAIRMRFAMHPTRVLPAVGRNGHDHMDGEFPGGTTVALAPAALSETVLPRLLSTLAAQAHFSIGRIADMQLLADALAAHAPSSLSGGCLSIHADISPRDLKLQVGPLRSGGADQIILDSAIDGVGRVIERLIDEHEEVVAGPLKMLSLRLTDQS
jgi:serine/threonine-protein kinase RsbW